MKMQHKRTKSITAAIGAAIAATAAPAFLVAGAAPAQAGTHVVPWTDALGVTVTVQSVPGPGASSGWCTYTAIPNGPGVPVIGVPFYLQEAQVHKLWFPGVQTGTTWDVTVKCPKGFDNPGPQQVVY